MTRFSDFANTLKASDIAELLALTEKPEVISFAGGLPAPELFPIDEMKQVDTAIYESEGRQAVQYGTTEGYVPLRNQIAQRMKDKFFVDCKAEDIVVTTGSQQALFILSQILINADETIAMESPSYMGAIMAFNPTRPKYVEVPTDDKGIVPEELDKILAADSSIHLIYVIPEFQNPTGITWPVERRKAFMDVINKYDVVVLEDDPYGEIRYDIEKLPSLKSMDTSRKFSCPACVLAGSSQIQKSSINSLSINRLSTSGRLHLVSVRPRTTSRCSIWTATYVRLMHSIKSAAISCATPWLSTSRRNVLSHVPKVAYSHGLRCRRTLMQKLSCQRLWQRTLLTYPNGGNGNHFRLNYSNMPEDRIVEGIKRLGDVLKEALK